MRSRSLGWVLVTLALVAAGLVYFVEVHSPVVEIDAASRASATEREWLPQWLPASITSLHGGHEAFDSSFVWIAGELVAGDAELIESHCVARDRAQISIPSEQELQRFPEASRAFHARVLSGELSSYYVCRDGEREFFAALDSPRNRFAMWAY